jgi:hypothetical protein
MAVVSLLWCHSGGVTHGLIAVVASAMQALQHGNKIAGAIDHSAAGIQLVLSALLGSSHTCFCTCASSCGKVAECKWSVRVHPSVVRVWPPTGQQFMMLECMPI